MTAAAARTPDLIPTGLPCGAVRWGTHLCHFYRTAADLEEIAVAFFEAGIGNNEKCVWITNALLPVEAARTALVRRVPDLDARTQAGQVAIIEHEDWLARTGNQASERHASERRIEHWLERERIALAAGFAGLRISGDSDWTDLEGWRSLALHEARLRRATRSHRISALCSYPLERCGTEQIIDILRNHKSALLKRNGVWEHVESAAVVAALAEMPVPKEIDAHEHLVVLQRITSALGDAVTFDDIGAVVTCELGPAIGASRVGLVIGGQLIALRGMTTPEDTTAVGSVLEHVPAQWSARSQLSPELGWIGGALVAVVPLVFANDRIGTLVLGFDQPNLSRAERSLVDDLVRQLSLSVERTRVYEQATQDRLRAERAMSSRDQFLAMLGHELRNPLSPILSATQLMRLRAPDQLVKERTTIERSANHVLRLIDELLDIAQFARGEIALAREPVELAELVERALDATRNVIDKRLRFAVAVPRGLIVDADVPRMQQVLVNIIINAAMYTDDEDGVEINARATGEHVELVIRDHGKGIDPTLLPHVFDLFVQGKQGPDRAKGGLGVGLPIARAIVELHGGTISAASEGEGTGSTFTIRLPRWQTVRNTDQIAVPVALGGRRIIVVDDNEDAAWLLAEALRMLGHDVRIAHEAVTALEIAGEWSPEVALLDIGLPGMNGYDLCRELCNMQSPPCCIAISGYGQPKDRALAREAGFEAHFVKPVDLRDVQAAIDALSANN